MTIVPVTKKMMNFSYQNVSFWKQGNNSVLKTGIERNVVKCMRMKAWNFFVTFLGLQIWQEIFLNEEKIKITCNFDNTLILA